MAAFTGIFLFLFLSLVLSHWFELFYTDIVFDDTLLAKCVVKNQVTFLVLYNTKDVVEGEWIFFCS